MMFRQLLTCNFTNQVNEFVDANHLFCAQIKRLAMVAGHQPQQAFDTVGDEIQVVLDVLVDEERAIGADLPQSRQTSLYGETPTLQGRVLLDQEWHLRTRANQRHLPQQHIDELRNFVKTGTPQKSSEGRHARILASYRRIAVLRSIAIHGAKLAN